eukprot:scaffold770_cov109-Cylindrotheca_fusiformis.AAC.10
MLNNLLQTKGNTVLVNKGRNGTAAAAAAAASSSRSSVRSEDDEGNSRKAAAAALGNMLGATPRMPPPPPYARGHRSRISQAAAGFAGDFKQQQHPILKEDPTYAKYFKMIKIGMPMTHVKHAMERDGLDPNIMDQDPNRPLNQRLLNRKTTSTRKPRKQKSSLRRARFRWNTLTQFVTESIWGNISDDETIRSIDIDEDEFNDLFQAETTTTTNAMSNNNNNNKTKKKSIKGAAVRTIDPKRANNGGIVLARVKMSYDEIAQSVDKMSSGSLTVGQIENIIEYLPTPQERSKLEQYMTMASEGGEGYNVGENVNARFQGLCECEKFMVSMMTVKRPKEKLDALHFKANFHDCLSSIIQDADNIDKACDELRNSDRLRILLGIVLEFGNRLNTAGQEEGTEEKKAEAFALDSLLKLKQTKAFDRKTTFLHYIAVIVQRNDERLLDFANDIPTVIKAEKIDWGQCSSTLDEIETQLENVRRMALYQAAQTKQFAFGRDNSSNFLDVMNELSLEDEMDALRSTETGMFTLHAIKQLSDLYKKVDATMIKFQNLLEYFGETSNNNNNNNAAGAAAVSAGKKPHELFGIFSQFSRDFAEARPKTTRKKANPNKPATVLTSASSDI